MARPSKFKPEFTKISAGMCRLGATDIEVADALSVSVATLNRWKLEHKGFYESIKTAKKAADERVERSLYASALGYEHDDVDIRVVKDRIVQTRVRKFYPPVPTSAIFWLKNRQPAEWRDKTEVEHSINYAAELAALNGKADPDANSSPAVA